MRCWFEREKKLTPIRIRARVRHGQYACAGVFQTGMNFVLEFTAINGFAAAAGPRGIPALDHEIPDDAMENNAIIIPAQTELREVVAGAGSVLPIQLDFEVPHRGVEGDVGRLVTPAAGCVGGRICGHVVFTFEANRSFWEGGSINVRIIAPWFPVGSRDPGRLWFLVEDPADELCPGMDVFDFRWIRTKLDQDNC